MEHVKFGFIDTENGTEVWVLADDWTALGASAEQAETITQHGWAVYAAPRPLPYNWKEGKEYIDGAGWSGLCTHGIFYVAGNPEGAYNAMGSDTLLDEWRALDAWLVRLVTRDEINVLVEERLAEYDNGYTVESYAAENTLSLEDAYADLAQMYGFPY